MKEFKLKDEASHIDLCDLLKAVDLVDSGGVAKHLIADGEVKVEGVVDTRKRRKVRRGETVEFRGETVKVI